MGKRKAQAARIGSQARSNSKSTNTTTPSSTSISTSTTTSTTTPTSTSTAISTSTSTSTSTTTSTSNSMSMRTRLESVVPNFRLPPLHVHDNPKSYLFTLMEYAKDLLAIEAVKTNSCTEYWNEYASHIKKFTQYVSTLSTNNWSSGCAAVIPRGTKFRFGVDTDVTIGTNINRYATVANFQGYLQSLPSQNKTKLNKQSRNSGDHSYSAGAGELFASAFACLYMLESLLDKLALKSDDSLARIKANCLDTSIPKPSSVVRHANVTSAKSTTVAKKNEKRTEKITGSIGEGIRLDKWEKVISLGWRSLCSKRLSELYEGMIFLVCAVMGAIGGARTGVALNQDLMGCFIYHYKCKNLKFQKVEDYSFLICFKTGDKGEDAEVHKIKQSAYLPNPNVAEDMRVLLGLYEILRFCVNQEAACPSDCSDMEKCARHKVKKRKTVTGKHGKGKRQVVLEETNQPEDWFTKLLVDVKGAPLTHANMTKIINRMFQLADINERVSATSLTYYAFRKYGHQFRENMAEISGLDNDAHSGRAHDNRGTSGSGHKRQYGLSVNVPSAKAHAGCFPDNLYLCPLTEAVEWVLTHYRDLVDSFSRMILRCENAEFPRTQPDPESVGITLNARLYCVHQLMATLLARSLELETLYGELRAATAVDDDDNDDASMFFFLSHPRSPFVVYNEQYTEFKVALQTFRSTLTAKLAASPNNHQVIRDVITAVNGVSADVERLRQQTQFSTAAARQKEAREMAPVIAKEIGLLATGHTHTLRVPSENPPRQSPLVDGTQVLDAALHRSDPTKVVTRTTNRGKNKNQLRTSIEPRYTPLPMGLGSYRSWHAFYKDYNDAVPKSRPSWKQLEELYIDGCPSHRVGADDTVKMKFSRYKLMNEYVLWRHGDKGSFAIHETLDTLNQEKPSVAKTCATFSKIGNAERIDYHV